MPEQSDQILAVAVAVARIFVTCNYWTFSPKLSLYSFGGLESAAVSGVF